jgi:hypothetical protein
MAKAVGTFGSAQVSGLCGGQLFRTNRNGIIISQIPWSPRWRPNTTLVTNARFKTVVQSWSSISDSDRRSWEDSATDKRSGFAEYTMRNMRRLNLLLPMLTAPVQPPTSWPLKRFSTSTIPITPRVMVWTPIDAYSGEYTCSLGIYTSFLRDAYCSPRSFRQVFTQDYGVSPMYYQAPSKCPTVFWRATIIHAPTGLISSQQEGRFDFWNVY